MKPGSPDLLGATWTGEGVNFAIRSRAATRVDVCLYDARASAKPRGSRCRGAPARCITDSWSRSWRASARCTASACMASTIRAKVIASTPTNCCSIRGRATSWASRSLDASDCSASTRRSRGPATQPGRQRGGHAALPRHRRQLRLEWRPTAGGALARHLHLRAARQGIHAAASGRAARVARQVPRPHRAGGASST